MQNEDPELVTDSGSIFRIGRRNKPCVDTTQDTERQTERESANRYQLCFCDFATAVLLMESPTTKLEEKTEEFDGVSRNS